MYVNNIPCSCHHKKISLDAMLSLVNIYIDEYCNSIMCDKGDWEAGARGFKNFLYSELKKYNDKNNFRIEDITK